VRENERGKDGETESDHQSERAPLKLSPPVGRELPTLEREARERVKSNSPE